MTPDRLKGLGAIPMDGGVRFSVLAPKAESITLVLFRTTLATRATCRHELVRTEDGIWEIEVQGARLGDLYAYSVAGPRDGHMGESMDSSKLLLDPWAIEIGRIPAWDLEVDPPFVVPGLARVTERRFDWQGVTKPVIEPSARVIYEAHVRGLTMLHEGLPERLRGTYLGVCHPKVVAHLKGLGITTLELLPVHAHFEDRFLREKGLANFWGYSTLSWFAPHPSYASAPEHAFVEFRTMVRELHRAGIEVVLDVVYNHSCEGGVDGLDLSLRGFGDWYLRDENGSFLDLTGCGNTLDFSKAPVREFVLQSLRHWVENGHVDGFRFDLASVHGRVNGGFDPMAPFFTELAQDRVLAEALWIAEPWDATREGYGLGRFPSPWLEWNDRFRDEARLFWKGLGSAKGFGLRLAGSPDIFVDRPYGSSVNYVACHDGFTARDLASWNEKHNQANQEENRDGSDWNHSDNFGVEGETSDPEVLEGRARRVRNLLASALLSQGTPLLLAGDELGRTQAGNNNAYCQDNAISWVNWTDPNPWPDPAWIRQVLEVRSQFPLPDSWEWIGNPQDDDQLLGVMLRSGVNSRVLVANRSSKAVRVELPIGTWRLRFDSGSGVGEEDQNWSDGIIEVGPSTLFVLDSSQIDPA